MRDRARQCRTHPAMGHDKANQSTSDAASNTQQVNKDSMMSSSMFPSDFAYWKLTPPALGLLGCGVYVGFRKQLKADAVGAEVLASSGQTPLPFNPYRHATRALMYGTALCLGCASVGVITVGYVMGVRNIREFSDKMEVWAPQQMHRLGFRHSREYIRDREAMHGMTYDQEWEYAMKLIQKEDPELDADNRTDERDGKSA